MRILIIEDDVLVAMMASDTLETAGHEIVGIAADVDEAIRLGLTLNPDLVLADLNLRDGKNSIDAVWEMRRSFNTPALFVSASPLECRRLGSAYAHGCLSKPYWSDDLIRAAEAVMAVAQGRWPSNIPANLELYEPSVA